MSKSSLSSFLLYWLGHGQKVFVKKFKFIFFKCFTCWIYYVPWKVFSCWLNRIFCWFCKCLFVAVTCAISLTKLTIILFLPHSTQREASCTFFWMGLVFVISWYLALNRVLLVRDSLAFSIVLHHVGIYLGNS